MCTALAPETAPPVVDRPEAEAPAARRTRFARCYRALGTADLVETLDELRAVWPEGTERPAAVTDAVALLTAELVARYRPVPG